jgi:hypothetical protein
VMNGRQWATCGLTMAATAMLLQACAEKPPPASTTRIFAADVAGGAKTCVVPKVAPVAGQETPVAVKVGNDGGWCGITENNGGKPYAAGLLIAEPMHGKVYVHSVGDDTRIDYTPDRGFSGTDAFAVKLIPGDATIRANVAVVPP